MQLGEAATAKGVRVEITDLYEYDATSLAKELDPVVFIVSCFGRGEPTDSAKKFFTWLATARPEDLKNLKYTVFGLGSSGVRILLYLRLYAIDVHSM
jgi:sulfite reductase alpha subunit-like flavoprotein